MGRAFLELGAVAVTAGALYVLWKDESLGGLLKFGLPLAVVLVVDRLIKFEALMALLTPVILIGGMASGLFTPTEAAVAAVAWALFLGFVWYRTLTVAHARQDQLRHHRDHRDRCCSSSPRPRSSRGC